MKVKLQLLINLVSLKVEHHKRTIKVVNGEIPCLWRAYNIVHFFLTLLIVVVPLGVEFQNNRVGFIPMRVIFGLWDLILILNPQKSLFGHWESILGVY